MFIDDLPVWGFVGPPPEETKDDDNIYIYTHKAFDVNYNENRVSAEGSTLLVSCPRRQPQECSLKPALQLASTILQRGSIWRAHGLSSTLPHKSQHENKCLRDPPSHP